MSQKRRSRRITIPRQKRQEYTYEQLYAEYWGPIQKLFFMNIKDYHDAEDLTQEVMIRVWKYWDRIQWNKLTGALAVIVNNVKYDYVVGNYDKPDKFQMDDDLEFEAHDEGITDPLRKLVIERAADAVREFIGVLGEKDREVFLDFYTRDYEIEELCDKYKTKRSNIYVQLYRIRELLLCCFERYDLLPDGDWNNHYTVV